MSNSLDIDVPGLGMSRADTARLLTMLSCAVYAAYDGVLQGTPKAGEGFAWMTDVRVGDLVMEVSTIHWTSRNAHRFGFLLSDSMEQVGTDEDGEPLTDRVFRLRLITDGSEFAWTNANFVRVPVSTIDWAKARHALPHHPS